MHEEFNNAVVVLCKCGKVHKTYGIRTENLGDDKWKFTWAFPIKESSAKREGYDKTTVQGSLIFSENYPGCPYCEESRLTVCSCGHLNCTITSNGVFTCEWCGIKGDLRDYTGEKISAGLDL